MLDVEKDLVASDGKILNGDGGEEAFGKQVGAVRVSSVGIFLREEEMEDAISAIYGG